MAGPSFHCANSNADTDGCNIVGRYACQNCLLVSYCGRACQVQDWNHHKAHCRSPLNKPDWQPRWIADGRVPAFVGGTPIRFFGGGKYLWGNVPALDLLQLSRNEGENYNKDLNLLLAASGDIRNLITTIASVPGSFKQTISVTLNDKDPDIVARNAAMLLIFLTTAEHQKAISCVMHVWYSALIRTEHLQLIRENVYPLVNDVCSKIRNKSQRTLLGKTWTFGCRSLRAVLTREAWMTLLQMLEPPAGLTVKKASGIRTAVTLAAEREDYLDRKLAVMEPAHRVCAETFRKDGLLLPLGYSRKDFAVPNPTFFRDLQAWPLKDSADPLDGWDISHVLATSSGPATSDLYGKLYYFIQHKLKVFVERFMGLSCSLTLYNVDATDLLDHLQVGTLDRVEVSNICDDAYLGVAKTLGYLSPLLRESAANPHATMIMLFMNAVDEELTEAEGAEDLVASAKVLRNFLPPLCNPQSRYDPAVMRIHMAQSLVRRSDKYFKRYMEAHEFTRFGQAFGMEIKVNHTLVEKWPLKVQKRPGQAGSQEEFNMRFQFGHSGHERYVEWKRGAIA